TGTVWKANSCADVLISLAWINAKTSVHFNRSIKFSWVGFDGKCKRFVDWVKLTLLYLLGELAVAFAASFSQWTNSWLWTLFDVSFGCFALRCRVASFLTSLFLGFCLSFCKRFFATLASLCNWSFTRCDDIFVGFLCLGHVRAGNRCFNL